MGISYMDDNSVPVGENGADSRAMNPNNIVELKSADASENTPMIFSGDPIIEARIQTNVAQQALFTERLKSSQMSGDMNKDMGETGEGTISHAARQEQ